MVCVTADLVSWTTVWWVFSKFLGRSKNTVQLYVKMLHLHYCLLNQYFSACNCSLEGSLTTQCNKNSGSCVCREGIGGYSCDECARGYYGNSPYCLPCGECFENWDRTIQDLKSIVIKQHTILLNNLTNLKLQIKQAMLSRKQETLRRSVPQVLIPKSSKKCNRSWKK